MAAHSFGRWTLTTVQRRSLHLFLRLMAGAAFAAMLFFSVVVPAFARPDSDGDGLFDGDETSVYHTNPNVADTDGDGSSDGEEIYLNTDPLTAGPPAQRTDSDGDGLFDLDETNVYNTKPFVGDTDGDGVDDGAEVANGTDPLTAQTAPKSYVCPDGTTVTPPESYCTTAPPAPKSYVCPDGTTVTPPESYCSTARPAPPQ